MNLFCDDFDCRPEIKVVYERTNTSNEENQHASIRFETQKEAMEVLKHIRSKKTHVSALWGKKQSLYGLVDERHKNCLYNLKAPILVINGKIPEKLSNRPISTQTYDNGNITLTFSSTEDARKAFDTLYMDKNREYKILSLPNHILKIKTKERPKKIIELMKTKPKDKVFFKAGGMNLIYAEFDSVQSATDCLLELHGEKKISKIDYAERSTLIRNDSLAEKISGKLHVPEKSSDICYVRNNSSSPEEKDVVIFENDLNGAFHGSDVEVQIIGKIKDRDRSTRKRGRVISKSLKNKKILVQLKSDDKKPTSDSHLILEPYKRRADEYFPEIVVAKEICPEKIDHEKRKVFIVTANYDEENGLVASKIIPREELEGTVEESFADSFLFAVTNDNKRFIFHRGAIVNDRVRFLSDGRRAQFIEVLERDPITCVGIFDSESNELQPMNSQLKRVKIPKKERLRDKHVYKVSLSWDDGVRRDPKVEIIEEIGESNSLESMVLALLSEWGFDYSDIKKRDDILSEHVNQKDINLDEEKRDDFSSERVFSIDPETAKDLDDALHIRRVDKDTFEVGVHIADVSHYVGQGTKTDELAAERTTSIYLPETVIPMLPNVLCEDLASLTPGEPKRTFTAIITMNENGEIVKPTRFTKGLINNRRKFSYEEAQNLLDANNEECKYSRDLAQLYNLSKHLRAKRLENGATTIGTKSPTFNFDKTTGLPVSFHFEDSFSTNKLIEEFMVLANSECARFLIEHVEHPVIRFHDSLREEKCSELSRLLLNALPEIASQITSKMDGNSLRKVLADLNLDEIKKEAIELMFIRCFTEARYGIFDKQEPNANHFGLALQEYTHFTSPIRRFPDLLVHRQLNDVLTGKGAPSYALPELEKHVRRSNLKKYRNRKLQTDLCRLFTWMLYKNRSKNETVKITGPIVNVSDDAVEVYWSETGLVLECLHEVIFVF